MPRDSGGNFTLVSGNPVTTGTVITSSWANGTLSDIASELTSSLDRSGRGGMSAPFKLVDGLVSGPGLAFNSELNSGLYRAGANDIRLSVAGADAFGFSNIASVGKLTPYFPLDLTQQTVSPSAGTVYDENPIINGAMEVAQRGAFNNAASGAMAIDRLRYLKTAGITAVHNYLQSSFTAAPPSGRPGQYSATLNLVTPQATIGASDQCYLSYAIEGYDAVPLYQRQLTVSFWCYSQTPGTYSLALMNGGLDRSCIQTFTHPGAVWAKFAVTFPASPTAGTWYVDNRTGFSLILTLAGGTSLQSSTLGAWQTGSFTVANTQSNGLVSGNTGFQITHLRIDPGPVAAPFRYRTFADELARCQRYFFKTFSYSVAPAQNAGVTGALSYMTLVAGVSGGAQIGGVQIALPRVMRTTPTITFFNPGAANSNWRNQSRGADSAAPAMPFGMGDNTLFITNPQVAADLATQICSIHLTADAEL